MVDVFFYKNFTKLKLPVVFYIPLLANWNFVICWFHLEKQNQSLIKTNKSKLRHRKYFKLK